MAEPTLFRELESPGRIIYLGHTGRRAAVQAVVPTSVKPGQKHTRPDAEQRARRREELLGARLAGQRARREEVLGAGLAGPLR